MATDAQPATATRTHRDRVRDLDEVARVLDAYKCDVHSITHQSWATTGDVVVVHLSGGPAAVDALADVFRATPNESAHGSGIYTRNGYLGDVTVSVYSGLDAP